MAIEKKPSGLFSKLINFFLGLVFIFYLLLFISSFLLGIIIVILFYPELVKTIFLNETISHSALKIGAFLLSFYAVLRFLKGSLNYIETGEKSWEKNPPLVEWISSHADTFRRAAPYIVLNLFVYAISLFILMPSIAIFKLLLLVSIQFGAFALELFFSGMFADSGSLFISYVVFCFSNDHSCSDKIEREKWMNKIGPFLKPIKKIFKFLGI